MTSVRVRETALASPSAEEETQASRTKGVMMGRERRAAVATFAVGLTNPPRNRNRCRMLICGPQVRRRTRRRANRASPQRPDVASTTVSEPGSGTDAIAATSWSQYEGKAS